MKSYERHSPHNTNLIGIVREIIPYIPEGALDRILGRMESLSDGHTSLQPSNYPRDILAVAQDGRVVYAANGLAYKVSFHAESVNNVHAMLFRLLRHHEKELKKYTNTLQSQENVDEIKHFLHQLEDLVPRLMPKK